MRDRRRMWGLTLSSLLVAGSAQAADVVVHGPSECPDSAELGFRVERNVGMALDRAPAMSFDVQLSRSTSGYAGRLRAVTARDAESKERAFTGASCEELSDAIVVAIALALGAAEAVSDGAPASGDAPESESDVDGAAQSAASGSLSSAAPGADAVVQAPPDESGARAAGWRPALSVAALVDVGSLPEPGLGAALGAELGWGRLRLRALGTLLFEQHTEVGAAAPLVPGADLRLVTGSVLGCSTALGAGALTLPLCLGVELGWVSGTGTNVTAPRSGSAPWAAPRADVGVQWCLADSPLCLDATLTASAPITRSRFELRGIGPVYRPPAMTGRLSLGASVGFD